MKKQHLPDFDRISLLSAMILLAYALARFVDLPSRILEFQLVGIYLEVEINANTVVAILVAGLTASGADWLIRQHPEFQARSTIQHWVLPGLAAWVLGVTLNALSPGLLWWMVFAIGAGLLLLVLVAEYTVVDPDNARFPAAAAGLTALSFALYLVLAITLRSIEIRLLLLLPALSIPIGLISLRFIYLRLYLEKIFSGENAITAAFAAITIAIIVGQITAALHYWSLSPVRFGLALFGPAYALTSLLGNLADGREFSSALIEPVLILTGVWAAAILVR